MKFRVSRDGLEIATGSQSPIIGTAFDPGEDERRS
jgi:hypothetical protein